MQLINRGEGEPDPLPVVFAAHPAATGPWYDVLARTVERDILVWIRRQDSPYTLEQATVFTPPLDFRVQGEPNAEVGQLLHTDSARLRVGFNTQPSQPILPGAIALRGLAVRALPCAEDAFPRATHTPCADVVISEIYPHDDVLCLEYDAEEDCVETLQGPWIELWNRGDAPVDLEGWVLTDDYSLSAKYVIPSSLVISSGDFLLIQFPVSEASPDYRGFGLSATSGMLSLLCPNQGASKSALNGSLTTASHVPFGSIPDEQALAIEQQSRTMPVRDTRYLHSEIPSPFEDTPWGNGTPLRFRIFQQTAGVSEWRAISVLLDAPRTVPVIRPVGLVNGLRVEVYCADCESIPQWIFSGREYGQPIPTVDSKTEKVLLLETATYQGPVFVSTQSSEGTQYSIQFWINRLDNPGQQTEAEWFRDNRIPAVDVKKAMVEAVQWAKHGMMGDRNSPADDVNRVTRTNASRHAYMASLVSIIGGAGWGREVMQMHEHLSHPWQNCNKEDTWYEYMECMYNTLWPRTDAKQILITGPNIDIDGIVDLMNNEIGIAWAAYLRDHFPILDLHKVRNYLRLELNAGRLYKAESNNGKIIPSGGKSEWHLSWENPRDMPPEKRRGQHRFHEDDIDSDGTVSWQAYIWSNNGSPFNDMCAPGDYKFNDKY